MVRWNRQQYRNILRVWHPRHLSHFTPIPCSWWAPPPPHFITCQWVRRERHSRRHCWASAARQCNLVPYSRKLSSLNFVPQFNHVFKLSLKLRTVQFLRLRAQVRKKLTALSPQSYGISSTPLVTQRFPTSSCLLRLFPWFPNFKFSNPKISMGSNLRSRDTQQIQPWQFATSKSVWREQYPSTKTSNEIEHYWCSNYPQCHSYPRSVTAIPRKSLDSSKSYCMLICMKWS